MALKVKDAGLRARLEDACSCCGGFYAHRSAGNPLCIACHWFLFPISVCDLDWKKAPQRDKSDSDDSGTEEPVDFYETLRPPPSKRVLVPKNRRNCDQLSECLQGLSVPRIGDMLEEGLLESLPEEVILVIFSFLDDISLWSVSLVCQRWRDLIFRQLPDDLWKCFVQKRWPLLNLESEPHSWRILFSKMVHSSCCLACLQQTAERLKYSKVHYHYHQTIMPPMKPSTSRNGAQEPLRMYSPPAGLENSLFSYICRDSRISHEMALLATDPLEGVSLKPIDNVFYGEWHACICGPSGSPFEGGVFYLSVHVPCRYPMDPPIVRFLTKIFHPNISRHGDIGLDSLHHNWSLALTLSKTLLSIQSLLTDPYTKVCMEPDIGNMYRENVALYEHTARLWTMLYAKHHLKPV